MRFDYDIIVIGGGHAGCEAASAAARLGSRTLLVTMDMSKLANMSCNPAVGGVAKGQIVREIDALGGMMGVITDRTTIQFRMLNRSKGAAMWSPRAQCDKEEFSRQWRRTLETTENLYIWQDSVIEIITEKYQRQDIGDGYCGKVTGIITATGAKFTAEAIVLTAGTFLNGLMHTGRHSKSGGRAGDSSSTGLTENIAAMGFEIGRMKTGTPARIDARTLNFELFEPQEGEQNPGKFSYLPDSHPVKRQIPCFLVHTNKEVHDILRQGFEDSPLFNGTIKGIGPRYCPSIEDKLNTFSGKDSHQLFLEPEGYDTTEYYLNGFSSSLPLDIQIRALQKIQGFEDIHIFRPGYAIEYDYFPPTQLKHSLETKLIEGLYFAGQVNGTTGYEEAGAQGLMAGINARRKLQGKEPLVLRRDEAYIGVLIDDLVTKGVDEPYRMFTSRAEYRILLRQDNADLRLTPISIKIGLADAKRIRHFEEKKSLSESLKNFIRERSTNPAEISEYLNLVNSATLSQGRKLYELLLRNEITLNGLINTLPDLQAFINENNISEEIIQEIEIQVKYRGYIEREKFIADKLRRLEDIRIPSGFDYNSMNSLTIEARQKLSRINPETIGQASRIPGVSPADINVLLVFFGR